jgi:putative serine protease PepD
MRSHTGVKVVAVAVLAAVAGAVAGAIVSSSEHGATTTIVRASTVTTVASTAAPDRNAPALESRYHAVVAQVAPSVVQIETAIGLGSGVVFDTKGDIVTNNHVVQRNGGKLTVTLANGRRYEATLVGQFKTDDLAVVRIKARGLRPLPFASSSTVQVGDIVLAIGNPLGLQSSVTEGIVSGLGRTVSEPTGAAIPQAIQTSASINPGNSGGALVDLSAQLIGVPTLVASNPEQGTQAPGIGFAIPSDTVRDIASQLIRYGKVVRSGRAFLGIEIAQTLGGGGVYVGNSTKGGPAARAGIKAGDIVTAVNGKRTETPADLTEALAAYKPGDTVRVTVVHPDGSQATLHVRLAERKS